jgi:hypothetical protein
VDLFECSQCKRRYVVAGADDGRDWTCPACDAGLNLVVRRLPGSAATVASALDAEVLGDRPGA